MPADISRPELVSLISVSVEECGVMWVGLSIKGRKP